MELHALKGPRYSGKSGYAGNQGLNLVTAYMWQVGNPISSLHLTLFWMHLLLIADANAQFCHEA